MITPSSSTSQNTGTSQTSGFAQRTEQRIQAEKPWQQYNSGTEFHPGDIQKSLQALAEQTFFNDSINRNAYQEAILKSLTETINPEIGIAFWCVAFLTGNKEK